MHKVTMDPTEFLAQGLAVTEYYQPEMLPVAEKVVARFFVTADTDDNSWYAVEALDSALPKCPSKPRVITQDSVDAYADRIFNAVYWLEYEWTNYAKPWLKMGKHFYFICGDDRARFARMLEDNAKRMSAFLAKLRHRYRTFDFSSSDQAKSLVASVNRRVEGLCDSIDRNLSRFLVSDWCDGLPMSEDFLGF